MHLLVNRDGRHLGPYSFDQACKLLAEGKLHTWDLCWPDGAREWVTLDTIEGLADKAFALREQRRAEALAAANPTAGPSTPNPQFITNPASGHSAATEQESQSNSWMRLIAWSSLTLILLISGIVWIKFLNPDVMISDLERRVDNLTYERGENVPFTGTASAYFRDDSVWEKIQFTDGLREGTRTVWHINGNVALNEEYRAGDLISAESFDFQGVKTGAMINGEGQIILYYNDIGVREQELVYVDGRITNRKVWERDGNLLVDHSLQESLPEFSNVPPPAPPPVVPTTNSAPTNQVFTITNQPAANPMAPDEDMYGRTRQWLVGDPNSNDSRIHIDRRLDIIYRGKNTNTVIEVFGYPDKITPRPGHGEWWTYGKMNIKNILEGGHFPYAHFFINTNGTVVVIQGGL